MNDNAIEINNIYLKYRCFKPFSIKSGLFLPKKQRLEFFEAIRDVSFSVKKGDIVGVIGRNGSGKSTLLRAIAGIFAPDEGSIDLKGHSVSLLSIGVGFQKQLSGRENIFLSGLLLGFTETQILEKLNEIIIFAELGDFIDRPVKTYSSGMYSKLAFSITAILETDIILIDEVLSVGDAKFKKKSYNKMKSLISEKERTVLIVSHNTETLSRLCSYIIWMHDGMIKKIGTPETVLPDYNIYMEE